MRRYGRYVEKGGGSGSVDRINGGDGDADADDSDDYKSEDFKGRGVYGGDFA